MQKGQVLSNNTALTFNMADTLNLVCFVKNLVDYNDEFYIAITKGLPATEYTWTEDAYTEKVAVSTAGTLIYDDFNGIQAGYENFVIFASYVEADYATDTTRRYINIYSLQTSDSGTYYCSSIYDGEYYIPSVSGALVITVNTKEGQAHSTRVKKADIMTYSALLFSSSKLLL